MRHIITALLIGLLYTGVELWHTYASPLFKVGDCVRHKLSDREEWEKNDWDRIATYIREVGKNKYRIGYIFKTSAGYVVSGDYSYHFHVYDDDSEKFQCPARMEIR